jgi:hypothetical protein
VIHGDKASLEYCELFIIDFPYVSELTEIRSLMGDIFSISLILSSLDSPAHRLALKPVAVASVPHLGHV